MTPTLVLSPIGLTLGTVVAWLVLGLAAIALQHRPPFGVLHGGGAAGHEGYAFAAMRERPYVGS
jgi:hypothetical protein